MQGARCRGSSCWTCGGGGGTRSASRGADRCRTARCPALHYSALLTSPRLSSLLLLSSPLPSPVLSWLHRPLPCPALPCTALLISSPLLSSPLPSPMLFSPLLLIISFPSAFVPCPSPPITVSLAVQSDAQTSETVSAAASPRGRRRQRLAHRQRMTDTEVPHAMVVVALASLRNGPGVSNGIGSDRCLYNREACGAPRMGSACCNGVTSEP